MKFLVLLLLFSNFLFAQTPPLPPEESEVIPQLEKPAGSSIEEVVDEAKPIVPEEPKPVVKEIRKGADTTRENRSASNGTLMFGWEPFATWIPSKWGMSYTQIFNEKWSVEFEYYTGSINSNYVGVDLGAVKERRFTLQARRYVGNSFHYSFGPVVSDFNARLGSSIVASDYSSSFSAQNLGVAGGIGNRWQWSNGVTFGIDWFRISIPVIETKVEDNVLDDITDSGDQQEIKDIIRTFNRVPTFVLFGLNIGYTF
jgi:hypothetical protein